MKKLSVILTVITAATAIITGGCANNTQETTAPATTAATEAKVEKSTELEKYLHSFVEGDSEIYGTWQIEGIDYLSFIFRNDGLAEMAMDNEGDFTSLRLDEKSKTLGVSFMLGLNGVYSYELSDGGKTMTLTLNKKTTVLKKQKDYSIIPEPPKETKIDEDLLGWWKSEEKQIYYFGGDGIMYSNNISMETAYTYSAEKGVLNTVYSYGGEVKGKMDYNIKAGNLIMNDQTFKRFKP